MCCGRKGPRKTGRSKLVKKPQQSENSPVVVPEVPKHLRQDPEYNKSEEQKQDKISPTI